METKRKREGELALLQITLLEWISKIDVARLHADHDILQLERGQVVPAAVRGRRTVRVRGAMAIATTQVV